MTERPVARFYVDGFNLYRRCLASRPELKWLDVVALCQRLLPEVTLQFVHYFTANIRPGIGVDSGAPVRQQTYLRALRSQPQRLAVHLGKFRNDRRHYPIHPREMDRATGLPRTVQVRKLEEKGSDVHLAARMIFDASQDSADVFVLLSNDSDQVPTLNILRNEMGVNTGIIFPTESVRNAKELMKTEPNWVSNISREDLAECQLPSEIRDQFGLIKRPEEWR